MCYAEELAEYKARKSRLKEKSDENEIGNQPDDFPNGVPSKATITIKSKYKAPVNPDE